MSMLRNIFRSVRGYDSELNRYESDFLEAVRSRLKQDARRTFSAQLENFSRIYRASVGKEVTLYSQRIGNRECMEFANKQEELLLATAKLSSPTNNVSMTAELRLVKGRIFSIAFSKPPVTVFGKDNLDQAKASVDEVKILADPMIGGQLPPTVIKETPDFPAEWKKLFDRYQPSNFLMPLTKFKRRKVLESINARLPNDYLGLLEYSDGVSLPDCRIHGLADIRKVVLPDWDYYVLAEYEAHQLIAIKADAEDSELYLVDLEDNEEVSAGMTFVGALRKLLEVNGN